MDNEQIIQKRNLIEDKYNFSPSDFDLGIIALKKDYTKNMTQEQLKDFEDYQNFVEKDMMKADNPDLYFK